MASLTDHTVRLLLNRERHRHGKRSLSSSRLLRASAQARANQLAGTGILAHGTWWKVVDHFTGRRFGRIGENIADGFDTPDEVMAAWIASPEHEANILGDYTHVGVGQATGHGKVWSVNHFGKKA